MVSQRIEVTTVQRASRRWPLLELLHDTTLSQNFVGDGVTLGGVQIAGAGEGGGGSISSVNGDAGPTVVIDFVDLPSAPASFSGQGGKLLAVNSGATAIEFVTTPALDLSTTVSNQTGSTKGGSPIAPPESPDSGDVHVEAYSNATTFWVWNGSTWVATADVTATAAGLYAANGTVPAATARVVSVPADSSVAFTGAAGASNSSFSLTGSTNTLSLRGSDGTNFGRMVLAPAGIDLTFGGTGSLKLDGSAGTASQVVVSQGANLPPVWLDGALSEVYGVLDLDAATALTAGLAEGCFPAILDIADVGGGFHGIRMYHAADSFEHIALGFNFETHDQTLEADRAIILDARTLTVEDLANARLLLSLSAGTSTAQLAGGTDVAYGALTISATGMDITFGGTAALKLDGSTGTTGQVIQSQGAGLPPVWANPGGAVAKAVNTVTESYITVAGDVGNIIDCNSAGAMNVTFSDLATGAYGTIVQRGAGAVTLVSGNRTIRHPAGYARLLARYATVHYSVVGTEVFLSGDMIDA